MLAQLCHRHYRSNGYKYRLTGNIGFGNACPNQTHIAAHSIVLRRIRADPFHPQHNEAIKADLPGRPLCYPRGITIFAIKCIIIFGAAGCKRQQCHRRRRRQGIARVNSTFSDEPSRCTRLRRRVLTRTYTQHINTNTHTKSNFAIMHARARRHNAWHWWIILRARGSRYSPQFMLT